MNFRELLNAYREGKLTGEEKAKVEAAIEAQEAIGEYLLDRDFPEREELSAPSFEGDLELGRTIAKRIRLSFVKTAIIAAGVVLAVLMLGLWILPRVTDAFYYNPMEKSEEAPNALSADLAAFTEIFRPDYYRTYATAERLGYGEYELCIYDLAEGGKRSVGTLRKNKLLLYDGNVLCAESGAYESSHITEGRTYIALEQSMSMGDFAKWWTDLGPDAEDLWLRVEAEGIAYDFGFFARGEKGTLLSEQEAEAHLVRLLTYLENRPEFLLLSGVTEEEIAQIHGIIAQKGIKIKGFSASLSSEDTAKLAAYEQNDGIFYQIP